MGRQPPKLLLTLQEWAQVPPEARLEASGRRFTYTTRSPTADERARGVGERRILLEVEIVDQPIAGQGAPDDTMIALQCEGCRTRVIVGADLADDPPPCFICEGVLVRDRSITAPRRGDNLA